MTIERNQNAGLFTAKRLIDRGPNDFAMAEVNAIERTYANHGPLPLRAEGAEAEVDLHAG